MKNIFLMTAVAVASFSQTAFAAQWTANAHVTGVEGTYAPTSIVFEIDQAAGSCAAATQLTYAGAAGGGTDNQKAVYALLLTALTSGHAINVWGNVGSCNVNFIQITNQ